MGQHVNSKQKRAAVNHDAPVFKLKHTIGIKGFMGGQYNYNVTEASIYYRQYLQTFKSRCLAAIDKAVEEQKTIYAKLDGIL